MSGDLAPMRRAILKSAAASTPAGTSKPFGPFQDFQECVDEFEGDPDVDDPEALCAEMERNPDQFFGGFDRADAMLQNLKVTFVSGVDMPAQDSGFLLAKSQGVTMKDVLDQSDWSRRERPLLLAKQLVDEDEPEQKTWAPVLVPGEVDKQGDIVPVKEIERAAHEFLKQFRNIDTEHNLLSGKGVPIESYTLKEDQTFTEPDGTESREFPAGTWILGIEWSDEAWDRIQAGELTGLSIFGEAEALDVGAIAEAANGGQVASSLEVSLDKSGPLTPCEWKALEQAYQVSKQNDPDRICGDLWFNGTDAQREAFGSGTEGRARDDVPPDAWWDDCLSTIQASSVSSTAKALDTDEHEAISALVSEFDEDFGEGVANVSDLLRWVDATDRQEEDSAILLAGAAEDFSNATGTAPGEATVEEFTRWLADQLAEGQEEEQTSSGSVNRRAVVESASRFAKAASPGDEIRQLAVKAEQLDRMTVKLT